MLHGLIFKVGLLNFLRFWPILVLHHESREQFFTPTIYSRRGCGLLLPLTGVFAFSAPSLTRALLSA
jgi:hypothetical protein